MEEEKLTIGEQVAYTFLVLLPWGLGILYILRGILHFLIQWAK